jgi:hypothetical protein
MSIDILYTREMLLHHKYIKNRSKGFADFHSQIINVYGGGGSMQFTVTPCSCFCLTNVFLYWGPTLKGLSSEM